MIASKQYKMRQFRKRSQSNSKKRLTKSRWRQTKLRKLMRLMTLSRKLSKKKSLLLRATRKQLTLKRKRSRPKTMLKLSKLKPRRKSLLKRRKLVKRRKRRKLLRRRQKLFKTLCHLSSKRLLPKRVKVMELHHLRTRRRRTKRRSEFFT